jgi:dihydrodipicolinate synthase/N-acetylneuraminate lyase
MDGNVYARPLAEVFEAVRAGKDYHGAYSRYRAMTKVMKDLHTGVNDYGPMMYALSLQMKGPQRYQRLPFVDVTDEQKVALSTALAQIKAMS